MPYARLRVVESHLLDHGKRKDVDIKNGDDYRTQEYGNPNQYCAFTFRRVLAADSKTIMQSEVEIFSTHLITLLKEYATHLPRHTWEVSRVKLLAPFPSLVYNWDRLWDISESTSFLPEEILARQDLKLLMETIMGECSELAPYFEARQTNLRLNLVTFDTLWTLFVPGELIYATPFMNKPQVFTLESANTILSDAGSPRTTKGESPDPAASSGNSHTGGSIICSGFDFDGRDIVKVFYEIHIPKFLGAREINTLPCYPFKYHQEDGNSFYRTRQELLARGKSFFSITKSTKSQTFMYSDRALSDGSGVRLHADYMVSEDELKSIQKYKLIALE
jgi:uncharacterized protein DUF7025